MRQPVRRRRAGLCPVSRFCRVLSRPPPLWSWPVAGGEVGVVRRAAVRLLGGTDATRDCASPTTVKAWSASWSQTSPKRRDCTQGRGFREITALSAISAKACTTTAARRACTARHPGAEPLEASGYRRCYCFTITGSPMLTVLKYHSASAGLRLMQPWLTFSSPSELTAHGAECTKRPRWLIRTA